MSREPTTPTTEFIEVVTTTTMVPTIQQETVIPTTIRPIAIVTMAVEPYSNIIPDGYFYGSSPEIY